MTSAGGSGAIDQLPTPIDGRLDKRILHGRWCDQIDLTSQQGPQVVLQSKVGFVKAHRGIGFLFDQEIRVTARRVEIITARGGAENLQASHMEAATNFDDFRSFGRDRRVHSGYLL